MMVAALEFVFSAAIFLFQGATYDYYHIFLLTLQNYLNVIIMKKILLLSVVVMMATLNVYAQFAPGTWSIQPKIGIGVSNLTNVEDLPISSTSDAEKLLAGAALLGAEMEYQINEKVSFAFGLNYSLQGCAWENFKLDGVKFKNPRYELGYVNIPIVANCYIGKGFAIKGGLQFGILTDANFKMRAEEKISGYETKIETSIDVKKDFESIDISIPIGISYETGAHWVFDARYHLGLTNINNEGSPESRNSVFMITVGYKVKL